MSNSKPMPSIRLVSISFIPINLLSPPLGYADSVICYYSLMSCIKGTENCVHAKWVEVLKWISPLTFYATQADIFCKRTDNTVTWLFDDTRFKDWIAGNTKTLIATGIRRSLHNSYIPSRLYFISDCCFTHSWCW